MLGIGPRCKLFWGLAIGVACWGVQTAATGAVPAEVTEVRFAQQFSMGYLQFDVMKHQDLLAKHGAALGIPGLKASWITFSGPDMMNDALLSGSIDIASGGMPGLLTIWAKTKGTAQEVRGVSAMSQQPILLNSRNPAVHSVRDFTAADRIAMPAVKVSAQAVLLEMAAAREWGDASYDRLDHLTFSLSPPDATTGLLAGGGDFNAAFTVPPFQTMQLRDPAIHTVLSSVDLVGAVVRRNGVDDKALPRCQPDRLPGDPGCDAGSVGVHCSAPTGHRGILRQRHQDEDRHGADGAAAGRSGLRLYPDAACHDAVGKLHAQGWSDQSRAGFHGKIYSGRKSIICPVVEQRSRTGPIFGSGRAPLVTEPINR